MDGRHRSTAVCPGHERCPMLAASYYPDLCNLVVSSVRKTTELLGFNKPSHKRVILRFSRHHPPSRHSLNDAQLHGGCQMYLFGQCDDDCLAVYRTIVELLVKNVDKTPPAVELSAWCLLAVGDIDGLSKVLMGSQYGLSPCLLTSLLFRAIDVRSSAAVDLLLNLGASPNSGLTRKDRPLKHLLELAEDDLGDEYGSAIEERESAVAILRSLVKAGASDLSKIVDPTIQATPLHKLASYALYHNGLAKAILELTPVKVYSALCSAFPYDDEPQFNPMAKFYRDLAECVYNSLASHEQVLTIVRGVGLSFLRAGARFEPNPFCYQWFDQILLELLETMPQQENAAFLLNVLQASCRSTSDHGKFDTCHENPFKLQHLCRAAVLQSLPLGVKQRNGAIEKLLLPWCLSNYLKFKELGGDTA